MFFMFKRLLLFVFFMLVGSGFFFFFENGSYFFSDSWIWKVLSPLQHRLNTPSFAPYKECTWVWKTVKNIGVWAQECDIKWKKVSLLANDDANGFYYAIDSWKGYKIQSLAIQIFDYDDVYTPDELLDKIYLNLLKNWFLKIENLCEFLPSDSVNSAIWPIFHLVSKVQQWWKKSLCWEYGSSKSENKYFIITKWEKSKVLFINQMQKNIFDIQSIQILQ